MQRIRSIVLFLILCAVVSVPPVSYARDTLEQVSSVNMHLGIGPASDTRGTTIGGSFSVSLPAEGLLRGMHFDLGVMGLGRDSDFEISIPIQIRYTFLTGSPIAPSLSAGIGYYLGKIDGKFDHGLQLFSCGLSLSYFINDIFAIGLGVHLHTASVSLADNDVPDREVWVGYGINLTIAP